MKKIVLTITALLFFQIVFSQNVTNFYLADTEGTNHDLFLYLSKKQAVVLDFFFTTCGTCGAFVPMLEEIYQSYNQNNGWIKVISMECSDASVLDVNTFKTNNGGTFPAIAGTGAKSYWETNFVPTYGGVVNQVYVIIPDPSGQPQNSYIDFFNIGSMDSLDFVQLKYSLTSHGFHAGIENPSPDNQDIILFPNPATNICNINFKEITSDNILIEVYNLLGQRIISEKHNLTNNDNIKLGLNNLVDGNYIVKIQGNNLVKNLKLQVCR
ncbi:MAG: T9SS type A sorting domain-containing protein [Saprospiraceae bacterium]|nr:T9SS type A sorting domain-containing protein [Saprospiraceae bacterium]